MRATRAALRELTIAADASLRAQRRLEAVLARPDWAVARRRQLVAAIVSLREHVQWYDVSVGRARVGQGRT